MTRTALVLIAAIGSAAAGFAQQPARDYAGAAPSGTASLSGTVVIDGERKQPARRARVTLNNTARTSPGQTVTTDDAGRFTFGGLPAGQFLLQSTKAGYLTASYGAKRPERAGVPIAIKDGEALTNVVLTMARGGVIGGTLRDARSRPVSGVSVRLLRFGYAALTGSRTLGSPSSGSFVTTDDRGEYRAFGLPPGTYLVLAAPESGPGRSGESDDIQLLSSAQVQQALQAARGNSVFAGALPPESTERVSYAPVFHPGVTDLRAAAPVTLGLSEERLGIDLTVDYVTTARVSGTIEGIPADVNPNSVQITLVPAGPDPELLAGAGLRGLPARPAPDGSFAIGGVPPGAYTLKARTGGAGGRGIVNAPAVPPLWAAAELTVNGLNTAATLRLQPGITVRGRVVFEGTPPSAAELESLSFTLVPPASGGMIQTSLGGRVGADGRFTIPGVIPDAYRFVTQWASSGTNAKWTLKASTANGREALDAPLLVTPNDVFDWTVTYTDRPSVLSGVFRDRAGRAATDYFILVFSTDKKYWTPGSRRVRMLRAASDGTFSTKGLADGDYYLAALTDLENGEWNDASLLDTLVGSSIKVTLREGISTVQNLGVG